MPWSTLRLGNINAQVGSDAGVWQVWSADMVMLTSMITEDSYCNCAVTTHYASWTLFSNTEMSTSTPAAEILWISGHRRPQKFFQGGNVDILLILFKLLTMQCEWTFTKRFTLHTLQRKCLVLRQQSQQSQKCTSLVQKCFFFTGACFHTL